MSKKRSLSCQPALMRGLALVPWMTRNVFLTTSGRGIQIFIIWPEKSGAQFWNRVSNMRGPWASLLK